MKKIIIPSLLAITIATPAFAELPTVFLGLNMGYANQNWSDKAQNLAKGTIDFLDAGTDLELKQGTGVIGAEIGIRFDATDIYALGLTASYDYFLQDKLKMSMASLESKLDSNLSMFNASFDNYIRMSGDSAYRTDLLLGVGYGALNWHLHHEQTGSAEQNGDESLPALTLKLGIVRHFSESWSWTVMGRWAKYLKMTHM